MVEVLVGLAIVVTLVLVCFGAVRKMVGRAEGSACAERLHTLGAAMAMYANDHDGYLPAATTAEFAYREAKEVPEGELAASPAALRAAMKTYVPSDKAWFCPVDPEAGQDVLWLGQRHLLTSFAFASPGEGERLAWPPKSQLGREGGAPLLSDAFGVPSKDSDRRFAGQKGARSNHPDGMVNAIGHDLSLSRRPARAWVEASFGRR